MLLRSGVLNLVTSLSLKRAKHHVISKNETTRSRSLNRDYLELLNLL